MAITHVALDDSKRVIGTSAALFERLLEGGPVHARYEAGVSGYDLYRQLTALGVCAR
jgi:hypothetical protein